MDRGHDHLSRTCRPLLEEYLPLSRASGVGGGGPGAAASGGMFNQPPGLWPPRPQRPSLYQAQAQLQAPAPQNSWSSDRTRHRRSHYQVPRPSQLLSGDSVYDFRSFHFYRQLSEDSGFSSCGSSASSVADDFDSHPCPPPSALKASYWSSHSSSWKKVSSASCKPQFGTVASVLAAGVSDSEETDHYESDDEAQDGVFFSSKAAPPSVRDPDFSSKTGSSLKNSSSSIIQIKEFFEKIIAAGQENLQLQHSGRDLLDLGSNLATKFPMRATELPDKNLSLFLQNRSQYHRLGKFGATETLSFANCKQRCGFTYPVPPSGM